jgi:hypothetical protein
MSNDIEHRVFWEMPGLILIRHYGIDHMLDKQCRGLDEDADDQVQQMKKINNILYDNNDPEFKIKIDPVSVSKTLSDFGFICPTDI